MDKFIKIAGKLYNLDMVIKIEEVEEYKDIYRIETMKYERVYFMSIRLYFSTDIYLKITNFTIEELERLMDQ